MRSPRWRSLLPLAAAGLLAACSATPARSPASYDVRVDVSPGVNRDGLGRAAPVLVGVYELKNASRFDMASYVALQDDPKATLGDDLVAFTQFIVLPGETRRLERPRDAAAHAIGIVAGYREQHGRIWRRVIAIPTLPATQASNPWLPFWPAASPQRFALQVDLRDNGLAVSTLDPRTP
jgi:type VI secretion system protein VasD